MALLAFDGHACQRHNFVMIGWSKTRTVSARLVFNTFTPMSWLFELELHSYAENSRLLAVEMDYAGGLCFMCLCVVSCCPSLVDRSFRCFEHFTTDDDH